MFQIYVKYNNILNIKKKKKKKKALIVKQKLLWEMQGGPLSLLPLSITAEVLASTKR